jgi:hypothetical protein
MLTFPCFTNLRPPAILSIGEFDFHGAQALFVRGTIARGKLQPRE